jgi:TIR domain
MDSQQREYSAFISYATADKAKAEEICAYLEARGLRCWIAPRDIRAGREYANEIIDAIERAPVLVLVLSAAANESQFVRREVERAVTKGDPVIPVRIENVMPSTALELFVSATHWIDAWTGDFAAHMDRLVRDLAQRPSAIAAGSLNVARTRAVDNRSAGPRRAWAGAAAVVLVTAVAGAAYLYGVRQGAPEQSLDSVHDVPAAPLVPTAPADPPPSASSKGPTTVTPAATIPRSEEVPPTPAPTGRTQTAATSQAGPPAGPAAPQRASPPPVQQTAQPEGLEELRQQAAALAIRARVVDQSLNRLAEQMRPNGLRGDMLVRQQSVAASLASGQRALDRQDVADATKYFDMARSDVEALERFLGR